MTKLEKDIIAILEEDCRYPVSKIAVMLNEKEEAVAKAIQKLEKDGTIVKYSAIINDNSDESVEALIEVKVTPQKSHGFDAIAEDIYNHQEVKSVFLMSGGYDLVVMIEGKSLKEVARFVSERLSTLDTVISTSTHFILKKYKIEGTITDKKDSTYRMSIQP